jgi:septal ring factor EnvC (AmiA/AmiB activator)
MPWLEILKSWEVLLGLILTVFGILASALAWWDKRNRRYFDGQSAGLQLSAQDQGSRLEKVENQLVQIDNDLDRIKGRMQSIESRLDTLATSRELGDVRSSIAALQAHSEAQNTTLRMLYEAAMRADTGRSRS